MKVQIKTRPSGKFKDEELDKGIQALQEKYSEFFERKLGNLGGYLDKNVFKVRVGSINLWTRKTTDRLKSWTYIVNLLKNTHWTLFLN